MNLSTLFWMLAAIIVGTVGIRYAHNTPIALACTIAYTVCLVIGLTLAV